MVHKIEMTPEERRAAWKAGLGLSTPKVVQPKWKPIETAPKTGDMLLWDGQFIHIGKYNQEYDNFYAYDLSPPQCYPTHWMELPSPPDIIGEQIIREEEEAEIRRKLDFEEEFPNGIEGDE